MYIRVNISGRQLSFVCVLFIFPHIPFRSLYKVAVLKLLAKLQYSMLHFVFLQKLAVESSRTIA